MFGTGLSIVFLLPLVLLCLVLTVLAILMPYFIYRIKNLLESNELQNKEIATILRDISKQQMNYKAVNIFGGEKP